MKNKILTILAVGLLSGPQAANADLVQSTTSVYLTFRQCVSDVTVCDSLGRTQKGTFGGLPGDLLAQASQDDPAFGQSTASAQLTGPPGAAELSASATSLPATRNGSNGIILQRYTNTGASAETLTFDLRLTYDQTVPTRNADFPPDNGAHSGALAEIGLFSMDADSLDVGTTAEEHYFALMLDPEPIAGFTDLGFAGTGPLSNVTGSDTTTLTKTVIVNPGDSIWLWAILQSLATNGAVVNASLEISLGASASAEAIP